MPLRLLAVACAVALVGTVAASGTARAAATLHFASRTWSVKASSGKVGPGPNVFSAQNAWVGADGLHLRIDKVKGVWRSAEVVGDAGLGYGTYRWTVTSDVGGLDRNVVLGLFTWSDDPTDAHRELDVEFARWGSAATSPNASYTVQPYDLAGHTVRFAQPRAAGTVHEMTWAPGSVTFASTTAAGAPIARWTYTGIDVPRPGDEAPRMNLWLFQGRAPSDGRAVEVVLSGFHFTPPS